MKILSKNNILFVHYGDNWIRGSEVALLQLLCGIDKTKYDMILVCNQEIIAKKAEEIGIKTFIVQLPIIMKDGDFFKFEIVKWVKAIITLFQLIKKYKIDLLYLNNGRSAQAGYYAARLAKVPAICHVHWNYYFRHIFLYRFYKVDTVIFVSNKIKEHITKKIKFKNECKVVYNGVDTDKYHPIQKRDESLKEGMKIGRGKIVIGQVSSLTYMKGVDILLKAFKLLKDKYANTHLVIVGDGPGYTDFLRLVNEFDLNKNVTFTGYDGNPLKYYQYVFDINVLASRSEALSFSLIEASACGLPNVAARVGGTPEVVIDNVTGFLFEKENAMDLSKKLEILLSDEIRKKMGENARKRAIQQFSLKKYLTSIESIIQEKTGGNE